MQKCVWQYLDIGYCSPVPDKGHTVTLFHKFDDWVDKEVHTRWMEEQINGYMDDGWVGRWVVNGRINPTPFLIQFRVIKIPTYCFHSFKQHLLFPKSKICPCPIYTLLTPFTKHFFLLRGLFNSLWKWTWPRNLLPGCHGASFQEWGNG